MTSFAEKVIGIVRRIPRGKTLTYGAVARRAGRPRAYRAVGNILNRYDAKLYHIPCHRVIRSDGSVGGYRWGPRKKLALLRKEKAAH
ncbi:MGMT family protein [Candidatus Parcubacteria bacterium]|nr:MAG: MGMT family protein [Candidatus Parcubacteria bacterium]